MAPRRLSVGETIGDIAGSSRCDDDIKKHWFDQASCSPVYSGTGITIYHGQALDVVRHATCMTITPQPPMPPRNSAAADGDRRTAMYYAYAGAIIVFAWTPVRSTT
jgi:hypothetical protein